MIRNCDHSGFHSGAGKLTQDLRSIRFVVVCDVCGEEIREVDVQDYAPSHGPAGNGLSRRRRAA
jgi:hypothetical protein